MVISASYCVLALTGQLSPTARKDEVMSIIVCASQFPSVRKTKLLGLETWKESAQQFFEAPYTSRVCDSAPETSVESQRGQIQPPCLGTGAYKTARLFFLSPHQPLLF